MIWSLSGWLANGTQSSYSGVQPRLGVAEEDNIDRQHSREPSSQEDSDRETGARRAEGLVECHGGSRQRASELAGQEPFVVI